MEFGGRWAVLKIDKSPRVMLGQGLDLEIVELGRCGAVRDDVVSVCVNHVWCRSA